MKLVALFQHDLKLPGARAHHTATVWKKSFKHPDSLFSSAGVNYLLTILELYFKRP
ncbi:hypothetical protein SAMN05660909_02506 [Chitinophaga terrae (ex Kim and Jung 2007)]|uniref:Uncharacterized protein n=1 Tax=Chitinophaga terrae (ex Kim and Jung 2007) TaxID=408074 RepID=A0A1H4CAN6_9BACT|nr:hypothetical protein SAMN05660909_02506 [Chitinophaga terrae (ex Kim and Jung 2007)]